MKLWPLLLFGAFSLEAERAVHENLRDVPFPVAFVGILLGGLFVVWFFKRRK